MCSLIFELELDKWGESEAFLDRILSPFVVVNTAYICTNCSVDGICFYSAYLVNRYKLTDSIRNKLVAHNFYLVYRIQHCFFLVVESTGFL